MKGGEVKMFRIVLYRLNMAGWLVPVKKSYRKARYRRHMSRFHDDPEFHKKKAVNRNA